MYFRYDDDLLDQFPSIRGAVIGVTDLDNGPSSDDLLDLYADTQGAVKREIGSTPLSDLESISAWRRAFSRFGVKPTQYRNAAESLLRRLIKQGDIPSINTIVDIANLVSISHRLPVAVFDQEQVSGGTTVRFAKGDEAFIDLGSSEASHPEQGEVIFVDEAGVVSARRWCWRQSHQSAAGPDTRTALITIEGLHDDADRSVAAAREHMESLLERFTPGADHSGGLVGPTEPRFEAW